MPIRRWSRRPAPTRSTGWRSERNELRPTSGRGRDHGGGWLGHRLFRHVPHRPGVNVLILLKTTLAGPRGTLHPGTHDVDAALARELIGARVAEPVQTPAKIAETAMRKPARTR